MRPKKEAVPTPLPGKNLVALRRGLIIVPDGKEDNRQVAASLQAELMNLGFMLDKDAFAAAGKAPKGWLVAYHEEVVPHLAKRTGSDLGYRAFYPNFPKQVMEASEVELFVNAFLHYLSDGRWEPQHEALTRYSRFEDVEFKVVKLGTEREFVGAFDRLVSVSQSLTDADKESIAWYLDNYREHVSIPKTVPFRETLCILAAKGCDVAVSSPTDALRASVYLSGGDISLPGVPKKRSPKLPAHWANMYDESFAEERKKFEFKRFSRAERRLILGLLERTSPDTEEGLSEMQSRLGRWLRLGEVLHPGEYAKKFPKCAVAFTRLRNQGQQGHEKVRTFHGRVDLAFKKNWKNGVDALAERPGELARRLDWLVRTFESKYVLEEFSGVGHKVSSKVLFELADHFDARGKKDAVRSIIIKGARSKSQVLEPLPPLDKRIVDRVKKVVDGILRSKVARLPKMGSVWIDERLKDVPVPSAMRSMNSSVRTYVRGTRIPFRKDAKVVRPFVHWFDEHGTIDIDLGVGLYTESLSIVHRISYYELKVEEINSCHSGDIRHRKGACAEYVDLDVAKCLEKGIRYALVQVHNFDGRPLHNVKDAVFGLMEREHPEAGAIFVPKTISDCVTVANESSSVNVCILDLKEKCYIWMDLEGAGFPCVDGNADKNGQVMLSLLKSPKLSVYDLLRMHAEERGSLVPSKQEAKVKFAWEDFVTDYSKSASYMTF